MLRIISLKEWNEEDKPCEEVNLVICLSFENCVAATSSFDELFVVMKAFLPFWKVFKGTQSKVSFTVFILESMEQLQR
jgi:hypothetical protein